LETRRTWKQYLAAIQHISFPNQGEAVNVHVHVLARESTRWPTADFPDGGLSKQDGVHADEGHQQTNVNLYKRRGMRRPNPKCNKKWSKVPRHTLQAKKPQAPSHKNHIQSAQPVNTLYILKPTNRSSINGAHTKGPALETSHSKNVPSLNIPCH
jgi:hypothetical protein